MAIIYIARENSDLTEGRGHMRDVGYFEVVDHAVAFAKGRGVMGVGDGEVDRVETFENCGEEAGRRTRIYGYRKKPDGTWGYGYMDCRDVPDPKKNPEYAEYLRLKEKFG